MQLVNNISDEKLRGGFYTPNKIASFILKWAFNGQKNFDILEPSCGDGVFLKEIQKGKYEYNSFLGIELDKDEAQKARDVNLSKSEILNTDFHEFCITTHRKFDLVIGNPPYIRYQYFDKGQQSYAAFIFKKADLSYSKLTNAWVSFVIGSSLLLKETGKIGFVLPAEILQVSFAKQLRNFLSVFYNKINIISFQKLVFPNIQQEVVLLLCEKNETNTHSIEHLEVLDSDSLDSIDFEKLRSSQKKINQKSSKWTFYFLEQKEIDFLEELQESDIIPKMNKYANIEVGITTGSNEFFTVPLSVVKKYNLEEYAKPLVGRSIQVAGSVFTKEDWENNIKLDARTFLLTFPSYKELNNGAREYIQWGVNKGIDQGYKCRIRDEWQIVPSLRVSDAFFMRRNNLYPRLIFNDNQAYTTDTMHRVTIKADINVKAFISSYYNSLSLASTEIVGCCEGGGVLELMPNEAENIFLPFQNNNSNLFLTIDEMLRAKASISSILDITNKQILELNYGLSSNDVKLAHNIWVKLSSRRLNRKNNV